MWKSLVTYCIILAWCGHALRIHSPGDGLSQDMIDDFVTRGRSQDKSVIDCESPNWFPNLQDDFAIGVLGGSVSARPNMYADQLVHMLEGIHAASVKVLKVRSMGEVPLMAAAVKEGQKLDAPLFNRAIPGTGMDVPLVCFDTLFPNATEVHMFLVEFSINDANDDRWAALAEKLQNLPHKPAVVAVETFAFPDQKPFFHSFRPVAERLGIPYVSLWDAVGHMDQKWIKSIFEHDQRHINHIGQHIIAEQILDLIKRAKRARPLVTPRMQIGSGQVACGTRKENVIKKVSQSVCQTDWDLKTGFEPIEWGNWKMVNLLGGEKKTIYAAAPGGSPIRFRMHVKAPCVLGMGVVNSWKYYGRASVKVTDHDYEIHSWGGPDFHWTLQRISWLTKLPPGEHDIEVTALPDSFARKRRKHSTEEFAVHLSGLYCLDSQDSFAGLLGQIW